MFAPQDASSFISITHEIAMEIQIAISKIDKYATQEGSDTLEVVERPNGGVSVVLADGGICENGGKAISSMVVRKVIGLLAEGVRDGAAARAASDQLFTERNGTVAAHLNILSADLQTSTLVIVRNNPTPVYIAQGLRIECINAESLPIGRSRNIRPAISEIPLESGTTIVMYTDGLIRTKIRTRERFGQGIEVGSLLEILLEEQEPSSQQIADTILSEAIRLDRFQPNDDMSVVVLRITNQKKDPIRRMTVTYPILDNSASLRL